MADICVPPDCLNGYDCYWLFFFCLFTGIPNLDALHTEPYEDPQRTTKTICITYCCMLWYILWYILLYIVILLYILLYISYIYSILL